MFRFALGVMVGALAYPLGIALGEELARRNDVECGYAFGAR